jgi:hypothetical protein
MEVLCTLPLALFFVILGILGSKNPQNMDDEEMMDQVMAMEIMDDDAWEERWD